MNLEKTLRALWAALLLAVLFAAPCLYGDGHIIKETSFTFMERTRSWGTAEVWISADKSCSITKNSIVIYRSDLKKRWTLDPKQKKYFEEALDTAASTPAAAVSPKKEKERMQDVGWDYEPDYDWTIKEIKENREIEGRKCRIIVAEGDADFAEQVCELWVTRDVPFDLKYYNNLYSRKNLDAEAAPLFKLAPGLEKSFILKIKYTTEGAISPTMIKEFKTVKIEAAEPPPGIYDIPPGFQRVDSKAGLRRK